MEGVNGIICYYCNELIMGDMNAFMEHNRINHFGIPGSSEASAINHPDFGTLSSFEPSTPEAAAELSAPVEPLAPTAEPSAAATFYGPHSSSSEASAINHPNFGTPSSFEPSALEAAAEPSAPVEPLTTAVEPSAAATLAASACASSTHVIIAFSVILLVVTFLAVSILAVLALLAAAMAVFAQMLGARATWKNLESGATRLGNEEIARQLLNADDASSSLIYKAADSNGKTHFHLAAENGQYSFFIMLVSYPDAIVTLDGKQRNILHIAALNGNVVIVKLILTRFEIEDLINSPDEKGNTPLHFVAKNFHEDVVNVLSKNKKVDIRATNHD
ncbi:hypothetical protein EZV62_009141 [Acer yangbiense]|uniref:Uncharacterized protein n=1 Tax=Acer yangbiense TaxID=1000413 RepID=A0A5C7IHD7_9ROSI|nr:hypothetical protein EZV62_009141 [Acer yangbiense]